MAKKERKVGGKPNKLNDGVFKEAVDDFDRFEDFLLTNLKSILVTAAVLAVAGVVGAVVYRQIESRRASDAAELLEADTVDAIDAALSKHPTNPAAELARMRLATRLFSKKDFAKALKLYKEIAAGTKPGYLRDRASLNVAYTLESMGKLEPAAEKFNSIARNPSLPTSCRNEAGYSAARLFLHMKQTKRARESLKDIVSSQSDFWAMQGRQLRKRL